MRALVLPLLATLAWGQSVPSTASAGANRGGDETIVMSPFEVTEQNQGYYGSNTMSGTRLNTSIADLAANVTVVTKEQMADFASLDLNDIFLYEAGTEGSGTFTDVSANGDGVPIDNTQLSPNTANRIRGISSANLSFGNFQISGKVPVDPLNLDAVEINRGPNSSVFGLGNAGGSVNLQPSSAFLSRNRAQAAFRVDSFDGHRSSLDVNRVLRKNFLAVRGQAIFQHDGFNLKPSGTDTVRLNGMVKIQPFKYTTISASYSTYRMHGNRPNTTTPLDGISLWEASGRPTFDPVTATIHVGGRSLPNQTVSTLPNYFSGTNSLRELSGFAVDRNGHLSAFMPMQASSNVNDPSANKQQVYFVITSPDSPRTTQPLWASNPVISDKSIYDWSSINLAAPNRLDHHTKTAYATLDQIIFQTPRQLLAAQAGFYREDGNQYNYNVIGKAGSSGRIAYLNVDVNERLINGQPNPNFMRPFLGINAPQADQQFQRWQTGRGQLAYRLDLRNEKNAFRWLGMFQATGYYEYSDRVNRQISYRDIIADAHPWAAPNIARGTTNATQGGTGNLNIYRFYQRYYVGDNGPHVDYAPHAFAYGSYPYTWGNGLNGAFKNETAQIGQGFSVDGTASTANTHQILKTSGVIFQNYLWRDRIIATTGIRRDQNFNKYGITPTWLPDGSLNMSSFNAWSPDDWSVNRGTTKTAGVVFKPRPWVNWLTLHLNVSDSFVPAAAKMSVYEESLPDPTGRGKDYGFTLNLLRNKLLVRVTRYDDMQNNARVGQTPAARVRAMDFDFASASTNKQQWLNYQATQWLTEAAAAKGQTLTHDQLIQQLASTMKIDSKYLENANPNNVIDETGNKRARGTEIEINYNPTPFWTMKLNLAKQESISTNLSPNVKRWIAERLPVWKSIVDPRTGQLWFNTRYDGQAQSAGEFLSSGVLTPMGVDTALEGKSNPQIRKYNTKALTSYRLAGITDQKFLKRVTVGGALRWESAGAIGYYGVQQPPAIVTDLDPTNPIYSSANFYVDAFLSYRTRLFRDKVGVTFQLNARNLQEGGRLQATNAYPDGSPWTFRIVDPRQYIFTATFEL